MVAELLEYIEAHPVPVIVAAGIVLSGLVLGWRDIIRLRVRRIAAIASVCFRQSIRRRVLWITPLVIVAIMVISQFLRAMDYQDLVRQMTVYSLFATGFLVALVSIILACTNLPKEIETRVIYTIATKPVTRLEIVLGKIAGFACVTFWILAIMGVFTYAFLKWQDHRIRKEAAGRLAVAGAVDPISRPTLEYYRDRGTLHARELGLPNRLAMLSHAPKDERDWWVPGGEETQIAVLFNVDRRGIPPFEGPPPQDRRKPISRPPMPGDLYAYAAVRIQPGPDARPATQPSEEPGLFFELYNLNMETVVPAQVLGKAERLDTPGGTAEQMFRVHIPAELLERWVPPNAPPGFHGFLVVRGDRSDYEYRLSPGQARLRVVGTERVIAPATDAAGSPLPPVYGGRPSTFGHQLFGQRGGRRVALFEFRDVKLSGAKGGYQAELRLGIEPDRSEWTGEIDDTARIVLDFVNRQTGRQVTGVQLLPENNRPTYFEVPAEAVTGGDFDVLLRMDSPGWANLRGPVIGLGIDPQVISRASSLKLVVRDQSFAWNLVKSLAILWLMSVLVIIVSIFCSTFLSWPIAIVTALVILCGRWTMEQMADLLQPGEARRFVQDMFPGASAASARALSESADALAAGMKMLGSVLPPISQFAALEDMERGVAIAGETMGAALVVALAFGIPLTVLSYIFLKHKEVAP